MTTSTFTHDALFYSDPVTVGASLSPTITDALTAGDAVTVCVRTPVVDTIRTRVPAHERLQVLPIGDRYTRPVDAVNVLWRFTRDALDAGARRVTAIGELLLSGSAADDDWYWYEAACNEVLRDLPISATCLYDVRRSPERALTMACATHDHVDPHQASPGDPHVEPPDGPVSPALPTRAPDLSMPSLAASRPVREAFHDRVGIDDDVASRASLVFTELIANAIRHGGGSAAVDLWFDDGRVLGRVIDDGPGISDPFATLRLPELRAHGVGLWIAHLESSRLSVAADSPRGTTAIALVAPR
jgi:signal transduction histidine kinase